MLQDARKVLKRIDPQRQWLSERRLVSRDESGTVHHKDITLVSNNKELHKLCVILDGERIYSAKNRAHLSAQSTR